MYPHVAHDHGYGRLDPGNALPPTVSEESEVLNLANEPESGAEMRCVAGV